jgi:hypothetical protein
MLTRAVSGAVVSIRGCTGHTLKDAKSYVRMHLILWQLPNLTRNEFRHLGATGLDLVIRLAMTGPCWRRLGWSEASRNRY